MSADLSPDLAAAIADDGEFDPMMPSYREVHHWTTNNLGEAVPGVVTPLCWSIWGRPGEIAARRAIQGIGVITAKEAEVPDDPAEWVMRLFYGRVTAQLEFMGMLGDRTPGTTGPEALRGMFDAVPESMTFNPTKAHYATILLNLARSFRSFPKLLGDLAADQDRWWRDSVVRVHDLDRSAALALFDDATARFERSSGLQLTGTISTVQPLFDVTEKLVERAGVGDMAILSGTGGAEMEVVGDIWRASRGRMTVEQVVANHGFHGPEEGELSSVVWREDDAPLRKLVERYAARPDSADPLAREHAKQAQLAAMQREVVAALPAATRPVARKALTLAAERIQLRGVAKRSFLQAIDIARASARRLGEHLVAEGALAERDDVFMLTSEELHSPLGEDTGALVARRHERRGAFQRLAFSSTVWKGLPGISEVSDEQPERDGAGVLTGTGVSAGVVEGAVRVVTDPSFGDVEPDEILVAPTTDPSWSSIMFISSALVVDLGGTLSHAAVVARELQIPCVVNTRDGTRRLRTGDRVRVDGTAGTVEILERA